MLGPKADRGLLVQKLTFVILTARFAESLAFYRDLLGIGVRVEGPGGLGYNRRPKTLSGRGWGVAKR